MIKNILLVFLFSIPSLTITAHQRTLTEMQNEAQSVFAVKSSRVSAKECKLQVVLQKEMLTVLGNDSQFVIVANNDAFRAIVGYADGVYTAENTSLTWFIDAVNEAMASDMAGNVTKRASVVPDASKYKIKVEALVQTTWSQREPYNNLCPKVSNGKCYPTGCVATALSQIMNYHKYPEHGIGKKQYSFKPEEGVGEILSADFENTTYEWDKMLNNYVKGSYSDEEANAVATLMLHCGVAVEMGYTSSGSGAYSSEARNGLMKFFGYNENAGLVSRDYYSLEQWMGMIYSELNKNRPLYYAGSDKTSGGHAFVIDGYDETGLVHVNWGWGADGGNGYYDITLLNPSNYQFNLGQTMIVGIDLPTAEVTYESHLVSDDPMSVTKIGKLLSVSAGKKIWNLNGDAWEGELAVVLEGEGKIYELSKVTVGKTAHNYNVLSNTSSNLGGILTLPTDVADGKYRLYVGAKNSCDDRWQLVRRSEGQTNCYQLTIQNKTVSSFVDCTDDTWQNNTTSIGAVQYYGNATTNRCFNMQGQRVGNDYKGIIVKNGRKVLNK